MESDRYSWWLELRHGGMLISPALLQEFFPMGFVQPDSYSLKYLREKYTKFDAWFQSDKRVETNLKPVYDWCDYVLENFLKINTGLWLKGNQITEEHSLTTLLKERVKPNRIYFSSPDNSVPLIAVFIDGSSRLGIGVSRKTYGRALQYLRAKNIKLGLLTNGAQFRLCYAGIDHESWVEWDAADWFDSSEFAHRLFGFYTLLGPMGLQPRNGVEIPLKTVIEESRSRQGELSSVLGEQVREAIELLVDEFNRTVEKEPGFMEVIRKSTHETILSDEIVLGSIFQASVRIIMRIVVILFAEARDLLPRSMEKYNSNYGIEGMFETLRQARSNESDDYMEDSNSGWIRLLGLFRIIYYGSGHPDLQIPKYGGELFAPGNLSSTDSVNRALALFEDQRLQVSNITLLKILEKLKFGRMKIKKGRMTAFVKGPVNFGELRTEYIGMIYEGILNYGLRVSQETMVLINSGLEPILPLSVLKTLSDEQLKDMFEKLSKNDSDKEEETSEDSSIKETESENEPILIEDEDETPDDEGTSHTDNIDEAYEWARKAVVALGWVKLPKRKLDEFAFNINVAKKARLLVKRVYSEGEYYLSLWGGTRKGTGTFYTKPQLAVPTVHKTLEPLVYNTDSDGNKIPKTPGEILSVKLCDISCGSASFLVASTHYLTDALYQALVFHASIIDITDYKRKTLPLGLIANTPVTESFLPCSPDEDGFEEKVKVRLRRYIVENCIYGVDINPMAVELARLSLWIETMDRSLPFEFLDHKIKVGNSLVGARLDTFQEYPLAAWLREGGDKTHSSSLHHVKDTWTKAIKEKLNKVIKPELIRMIREIAGQLSFSFDNEQVKPLETHEELLKVYLSIHDQSASFYGLEKKERIYNESIINNSRYHRLKEAMDLWCAIWFWPLDKLDLVPTPVSFYTPGEETIQISRQVALQHKFFHWEIEFPDVFCNGRSGFHAVVGNPPWEISKPNSKEFFSRYDPMYRSYGKQLAIVKQKEYFKASADIETSWIKYVSDFKALSNYFSTVFSPFGDRFASQESVISLERSRIKNDSLHSTWQSKREKHSGFLSKPATYRYQGSADLNLYKLFLERSYSLVSDHGRLGMIVPSGIYSDYGSKDLRELFLYYSNWEWLFSFENKEAIFDIHRSYKFNPVIVSKGGVTQNIKTAFMRHNISEWENPGKVIEYSLESVKKFSPFNLSLLEINKKREAEIIEKIYSNSVLLGDKGPDGWGFEYSTEFHMTADSKLFHNRNKLLEKCYVQDLYGRLIGPEGDIMLPLYEGRMITQYDFSAKGWVSGSGRTAVWRSIPFSEKIIEPQFMISGENCSMDYLKTKTCFMGIGSATNSRSMHSCALDDIPCGNSVPTLITKSFPGYYNLALTSILNSFSYDFILRKKMAGVNLNFFVIEDTPILNSNDNYIKFLGYIASRLTFVHNKFSVQWILLKRHYGNYNVENLKSTWALTIHERLRIRSIIDAIVANQFGISFEDMKTILHDDISDLKGFWRVDKDKPKELRQTTLALQAFKRLKEVGIDEFIKEDWQLPPDVQEALGPRFYDWQLQGTPEESWAECEYHAKQMLGEEGFKKFMYELEHPEVKTQSVIEESESQSNQKNNNDREQLNLF